MNRGFIKIWRKIEDSAVFADPHLLQLFVWCLLRANHKPCSVPVRTGRGQTIVVLTRGQFIFGRHSAAKELKCAGSTIQYRLEILKRLKMVVTQPVTHYSIVTIVNWASYQEEVEGIRQPTRHPLRHPSVTDKNYKNKRPTGVPAKDAGGVEAIFDLWNSEARSLPKATKLTESRKKKIRARLRERPPEEWGEVFRRMERSSFLRGESGGTFRADLDWIIANEGNALKVIEGRYDNREKRTPPKGAGPSSENEKILGYDTVGRPLFAEPAATEVAR